MRGLSEIDSHLLSREKLPLFILLFKRTEKKEEKESSGDGSLSEMERNTSACKAYTDVAENSLYFVLRGLLI